MKHLLFASVLALAPRAALAFSIDAHRAITARAVDLERRAWPEIGARGEALADADAAEDLNLFLKWSYYSHYFNPTGPVRTAWRTTSDVRVAVLWIDLQAALRAGDEDEVWTLAGNIVHHIQDMASPPHVVPVAHGLGDGFEGYDVDGLIASTHGYALASIGAVEAHRELAWRTWNAVHRGTLPRCGQQVGWTEFWSATPGRFGDYGRHTFGDAGGCADQDAAMRAFASERVDDAVTYTRAFLRGIAQAVGARFGR